MELREIIEGLKEYDSATVQNAMMTMDEYDKEQIDYSGPDLKSFHLDQINKARQLFAKTFIPNGYGDIIKTENIFKGFIHGKSVGYFVNNEFNSDIDNIDEFKSTERFLRQFL